MATYEYKMPSLGADMDHGKIIKWLIQPGEKINKGDIIAEVETPKANIEIESWKSGKIKDLIFQEGHDVKVGTPILLIETEEIIKSETTQPLVSPSNKKIFFTPRAKKIISTKKMNLELIKDSLKLEEHGSVITGDDILNLKKVHSEDTTKNNINERQQIIAKIMQRSKMTIPHFYLEKDIDISKMLSWMHKKNEKLDISQRLLPIVFFIKAIAIGLKKYPIFNSYFKDDQIIFNEEIHLAIVISLRAGGLVAPAISNPESKGVVALMQEFKELIIRAREGKLTRNEMQSATITLTSLGDQGADKVYGVIYPPQVCILGIGAIRDDTITLTMSADHRATDAHQGSLFFHAINKVLQDPFSME